MATIDSAAFSLWLDYNTYKGMLSNLQKHDTEGLRSADGSELRTTEMGITSFVLWKCRFHKVLVRLMGLLPRGILIGRQFLSRYGLEMSFRTLRGSMRVEQLTMQGILHTAEKQSEGTLEVIEGKEGNEVISKLTFDDFGTDRENSSLRAVIWKHRDLFKDMGTIANYEHTIVLEDGAASCCAPIKRRSPKEEEMERAMVAELAEKGVLEPSLSPWAANNVFVPKKDCTTRCTSDFRELYAPTVPNAYPMEAVPETPGWVSSQKIFSAFDLKRRTVWTFMDDRAVGTKSATNHIEALDQVLQRIVNIGMKLKLSKCAFGKREIELLGHRITPEGILPFQKHVEGIQNLQEPTNGTELLRFFGLVNYFAQCIPHSSEQMMPLHEVLEDSGFNKKKKYRNQRLHIPKWNEKWGYRQVAAWTDLKKELTCPTVLMPYDRFVPKRILTDAMDWGRCCYKKLRKIRGDPWRM